MLVLVDYARHVFAKNRLIGIDKQRTTLNHLAFEIPPDSYNDHLQRLTDLGIEVFESSLPDMNANAIFFSDPEGNLLELICHARCSDAK